MLVGVVAPQKGVVPVATEAQQPIDLVEVFTPAPQTLPELLILVLDCKELKRIVQITKSRDPNSATGDVVLAVICVEKVKDAHLCIPRSEHPSTNKNCIPLE